MDHLPPPLFQAGTKGLHQRADISVRAVDLFVRRSLGAAGCMVENPAKGIHLDYQIREF
jgi:hypothetical protein